MQEPVGRPDGMATVTVVEGPVITSVVPDAPVADEPDADDEATPEAEPDAEPAEPDADPAAPDAEVPAEPVTEAEADGRVKVRP